MFNRGITGADLKVRHNNTEESVFFIKGSNEITKNSIGNSAVRLDLRVALRYKNTLNLHLTLKKSNSKQNVTLYLLYKPTLQIEELGEEKQELEKLVNDLKAKCDAIEKRETERRALEEKKHAEEIQFLKRTNQQLKVSF